MPRPQVWVLNPISPSAMAKLSRAVECVGPEAARGRDWTEAAEAVIVRGTRVTGADIRRAVRLRIIGRHGVGLDTVDLEAAADRGVTVLNTPKANATSVAELSVGLALSLARKIAEHDRRLRAGEPMPPAQAVGFELEDAVIGIVGFGNTGSASARRFHFGFGARVLAHDPFLPAEAFPDWVEPVARLDDLLARARVISVHVPLKADTHPLIGARELQLMRPDACLLNLSRGGVVNETALAEALESGHVMGAASDVFVVEPPPATHPLLSLPNFVATPHIGAATAEALERVGHEIVDKVLAALESR